MNAIILSSLPAADEPGLDLQRHIVDGLAHRLGPDAVDLADLTDLQVKACLGCGRCNDKTPGICVHRDDFAEVFARIPRAELLVLASPVRFGVWDPELKLALDRLMPLLVGQYTRRAGELHHQLRYERPTRLLGVGLVRGGAGEDEAVSALVDRHTVNMGLRASATLCARVSETALEDLPATLDALEVA